MYIEKIQQCEICGEFEKVIYHRGAMLCYTCDGELYDEYTLQQEDEFMNWYLSADSKDARMDGDGVFWDVNWNRQGFE